MKDEQVKKVNLLQSLSNAIETVSGKFAIAAGWSLFAMTCVMLRETIGRYLFGSSWIATIDLVGWLMQASVFLAAAYVFKIGGYVTVDVLYQRFPPKMKKYVRVITNLAAFIFLATLTPLIADRTISAYRMKDVTIGYFPTFPSYIIVLLGCSWFLMQIIIGLVRSFNALKKSEKPVSSSDGSQWA